jgi:hypothetical protein
MRSTTNRSVRLPSLVLTTVTCLALLGVQPASAIDGLQVQDQTTGVTAVQLAQQLAGPGVTIDPGSVTFTGEPAAGGLFTGGAGIVGFDSGLILSSGLVADVVGPNESPSTTSNFGRDGHPDLTAIAGVETYDAALLDFEFEVAAGQDEVRFSYVFGSEEYNEFVTEPGTGVNDSFAFWVNGENCAVVGDPAVPITINTINNGQPGQPPINADLFINNDPFNPDSTGTTVPVDQLRNTEMDGFTVVLTCVAPVRAGTNTMRLAIADGGDPVYDSWVLLQAGSLTTVPVATSLVLAPASAERTVGDEHCVTATLTDQNGQPMSGESVSFTVTGTHPSVESVVTGVAGTAERCWTGSAAGEDAVVAAVGSLSSNTGQVTWATVAPPPPSGACVDLLAGQTIPVGDVCVTNDASTVTVTYRTTGGWHLSATHLASSKDAPGGGDWTSAANRWQNKSGNPSPGRFPFKGDHGTGTTTVSYTVPLARLEAVAGDLLYLAAHADVYRSVDGVTQRQGAWGAGSRLVAKGNWATFFSYRVS